MGPITLYDVVGLDVAVHAGRMMAEAFPDRVVPADDRCSSWSSAAGSARRPAKASSTTAGQRRQAAARHARARKSPQLIDECRTGAAAKVLAEELTDRLFLPMLLEATRVLEDGIVRDVRDVDLALIFGIGFPPFRGGLFFWADQVGAAKIVEKLKPYAPLGKRYEPTAMLTKLAASNSQLLRLNITTEARRTQRSDQIRNEDCRQTYVR